MDRLVLIPVQREEYVWDLVCKMRNYRALLLWAPRVENLLKVEFMGLQRKKKKKKVIICQIEKKKKKKIYYILPALGFLS